MSLTKATYSMIEGAAANPLDYGAVGDGVTDDTAALAAMFAASKNIALGDSSLTYRISGTLTVRSGTRVQASGAKVLQTVNLTSIFSVAGNSNIRIEGVSFQDTGAGYVTNDANPHAAVFGSAGATRITVTGCEFTGVTYAAVRFIAGTKLNVSGNIIIGPGSPTIPYNTNLRCYGVLFDAGCTDYICSGNEISLLLHGIRVEQSLRGTIDGNSIHNITGQHGIYVGAAVQSLVISDNTITTIALQGIKIQAENTYSNCRSIAVVGNTVSVCGDSGITLSNGAGGTAQPAKLTQCTIVGNAVVDCTATGINVQNAINLVVADNTIDTCAFSGISMSACDYARFTDNVITNTTLSGIRDQTVCTNITIADNLLHNVATGNTVGDQYGIFVQTLDNTSVRRNRITSAAGGMLYGAYFAAGDQTTSSLTDNDISGATSYGLRVASAATAFAAFRGNILSGTTGSAFNTPALPSVASAAALVLPTEPDVVRITGTTNITSIDANGHTGHRVTLLFDGALTVTRGSNLYAASNFNTSQFDTITLICDGILWLEVSRSVN